VNKRKVDTVYILFCAFKMFKTIEDPANCEIQTVIHFLDPRNLKPADIHHEICEVYGENTMSDGMVRKWVRKFNEGRDNVQDEPQSCWPAVSTGSHVLQGGDRETGSLL
jgi:hypothetical protein